MCSLTESKWKSQGFMWGVGGQWGSADWELVGQQVKENWRQHSESGKMCKKAAKRQHETWRRQVSGKPRKNGEYQSNNINHSPRTNLGSTFSQLQWKKIILSKRVFYKKKNRKRMFVQKSHLFSHQETLAMRCKNVPWRSMRLSWYGMDALNPAPSSLIIANDH